MPPPFGDNMDKNELYIKAGCYELENLRHIHHVQSFGKGLRFGLGMNKYACNICDITENSITFIKLTKPKYNKSIKGYEPFKKVEKFKKENISIDEVRELLHNALRVKI